MKRYLSLGAAVLAGLLVGGVAMHEYEQKHSIKKVKQDAFEEGYRTRESREKHVRTYRFIPNEHFPKGEITLGMPNYNPLDYVTSKKDANLSNFITNLAKVGYHFDSTDYGVFYKAPLSKVFNTAKALMPGYQFEAFKTLVGDTAIEDKAAVWSPVFIIDDLMEQSKEQRKWWEEQKKMAGEEDSLLNYKEKLTKDLFGPRDTSGE